MDRFKPVWMIQVVSQWTESAAQSVDRILGAGNWFYMKGAQPWTGVYIAHPPSERQGMLLDLAVSIRWQWDISDMVLPVRKRRS